MDGQSFTHKIRVTYAVCTLGNHVYYARYLDFLEEARGEFFRHLQRPLLELQAQDILFPVVQFQAQYLAPARYDSVLDIELWISRLQGVRLGFAYRIQDENRRNILAAESLHVCTNAQEKPRRVPSELIQALGPFLKGTDTAPASV